MVLSSFGRSRLLKILFISFIITNGWLEIECMDIRINRHFVYARRTYLAIQSILLVIPLLAMSCTDYQLRKNLSRPFELNAEKYMTLIMQDQFGEVEDFLSYVTKHDLTTRDGIRYLPAMLGFWFNNGELPVPFPENVLPHLDKWVETSPDNPLAYITRGTFYIDYAWHARGHGWAKDVNPNDWKKFRARMASAEDDLLKAYEIDHQNPHSTRQLMRVKLTHYQSPEVQEGLFLQAIAISPASYGVQKTKLQNLMPKWGGSWEAMFQFAIETAKNAPPKTLLPLILVHAHEEAAARSGDKKHYFSNQTIWNDVQRIYLKIISDFPDSERWKTEFGLLCHYAGRNALARQYWKMAVESEPVYYYKTYRYAAWTYQKEKNWALEETYARKLATMYPNYARGHALLGYALIQQKRYQESLRCYTTATDLDPDNPSYWGNRCYLDNRFEDFEQAVQDCSIAIDLDENYAYGYKQRRVAYERLGHPQLAKADHQAYDKLTGQ
jgi:tetratricopeptide (TPR) repeat protein